ncbi:MULTISPECIES: mitochondrial fission ELM1 family protein [unclassified Rickettsia]|uniref:mitochondrial fission ELM1 family protein n=1 Tax=unclassified Rickettsia TaxID=114295 RepID=UPI00209F5F83|nr:ELM1/GtrOC1 family putative glycosyltransferase [Rickettsia endosymbiont of Ceutorhynchus assimilis]
MNIWVLGDNRAGNTNQAIALAEELGEKYELIELKYNYFSKLPNYFLQGRPIHIKNKLLRSLEAKPFPDIIITAGRRTAALALYLKRKSNNKIKLIQIMQPAVTYDEFDTVILPYHDTLMQESTNVIRFTGALTGVLPKLPLAAEELHKNYPQLEKFIAVIIGGGNKYYKFSDEDAFLLSSLLFRVNHVRKLPFFISFSRRTPNTVKLIIKSLMPDSTIIYDPKENDNLNNKDNLSNKFNPYLGMLSQATYIVSTADSISMCSDAVASGNPLYIFCPPSFKAPKHQAFIDQLVEQKIAKIFDKFTTSLEKYNYTPLNEVKKVAEIIKKKF